MYCGGLLSITSALSALADIPGSPKDYTDAVKNTKTDSENIFTCGGSYKTFLVGSVRPAKGAKIYISSANISANTLVVKESTAGAWGTLTVTADGTRTGGTTSFAQTGTISWASTVATTKPRYFEGYYLYWYQFTINTGSAGIYHVTLDIPCQNIIDLWDGVYREITKCYTFWKSIPDQSVNVLKEDYEATSASTYLDVGALAAANYIEVGFGEKITALDIVLPSGSVNTNATVMSIEYWSGAAYVSVGDVVDGTDTAGASLNKSGVVSWVNADLALEKKKQYSNSSPLYYYKIKMSEDLQAGTKIDYIGGMTAPRTMKGYKFAVFAQGRILLCCEMDGEKNKATAGSKFMPQVYNGDDSVDVYFGEEGELVCGTELFSQFGSSLYSLILMFKDNETWVLAGQDIAQWESNTFLLSSSIGCPAPMTLKTINLHAEPGAGVNRALAIWQGANGVYMSDGRAPIPIHGDIKEYFDERDSRCIKTSMIGDSVSWVDHKRQRYHWKFASGTAATALNKELVYDIARNRWFEIDRTVDLQCGLAVHDTDGNAYAYGFLDTGYMYRLENGTTFDGSDITCTAHHGDMPLGGLDGETVVEEVTLIAVAKAVTSNDVTCTHYADTSSTGVAHTLSPTKSGYRIADDYFDDHLNGRPFHSFKYEMVTNDETVGFEPIAAVVSFHEV
jgi:hypothetical protein